jgi:hypothetical protein
MSNLPKVPPGYKWRMEKDGLHMLDGPKGYVPYPNRVYRNELTIWQVSTYKFMPVATINSPEEAYAILAARAWCGLPIGGECA